MSHISHSEYLKNIALLSRAAGGASATQFCALVGDHTLRFREQAASLSELSDYKGFIPRDLLTPDAPLPSDLHEIHATFFPQGVTPAHLAFLPGTRSAVVKLASALASDFVHMHKASDPIDRVVAAERFLGRTLPGPALAAKHARASSFGFLTKTLKVALFQGLEGMRLVLKQVGARAAPVVSDRALRDHSDALADVQAYLSRKFQFDEYSRTRRLYRMVDLVAKPAVTTAELLARVAGVDKLAASLKLEASMLTITLPSEYHASPSYGQDSYAGFSHNPGVGVRMLQAQFARVIDYIRRAVAQPLGFRIIEAHKDGTPHLHALLYYPTGMRNQVLLLIRSALGLPSLPVCFVEPSEHGSKVTGTGKRYDELHYNLGPSSRLVPAAEPATRRADVRVLNPDVAKPSSYVSKYIIDTVVSSGTKSSGRRSADESRRAHAAHASLWGYRRFSFYGIHAQTQLWRACRRLESFRQNACYLKPQHVPMVRETFLKAAEATHSPDLALAVWNAFDVAAHAAGTGDYETFGRTFGALPGLRPVFKVRPVRALVPTGLGAEVLKTVALELRYQVDPSMPSIILPTCDPQRWSEFDPCDLGDYIDAKESGFDLSDLPWEATTLPLARLFALFPASAVPESALTP